MLVATLLAAAAAAHSIFAPIPQLASRHIRLLTAAGDRLFAVEGNGDQQRVEIIHLPGFTVEDATARIKSGTAPIQDLVWDAAREELWVINASDSGRDCYSPDLEIRRRYIGAWHPEPFLELMDAVEHAQKRVANDELGSLSVRGGVALARDWQYAATLAWIEPRVVHPRARARVVVPAATGPSGARATVIGECAGYVSTDAGLTRVDLRTGATRRLPDARSLPHVVALAATSGSIFAATSEGGLYAAPERSLAACRLQERE